MHGTRWTSAAIGIAAAAATGLGPALAPAQDAAPVARPRIEVPLLDGVMLRVAAKVNGATVAFLVDTGASQNVLDQGEAETLGIKGGMRLPALGVGSQMVSLARLDTLEVGPWKGERLLVALMDLSGAKAGFGGELHGILGIPWLSKWKEVEIDFPARVLRLSEWLPGETRPVSPFERLLGGGLDRLLDRATGGRGKPAEPTAACGVTCVRAEAVLRAQLGLGDGEGLVLTAVAAGSPAGTAGLHIHDCLTHVGDAPATAPDQVARAFAALAPGAAIEVRGIRRGARFRCTLRREE